MKKIWLLIFVAAAFTFSTAGCSNISTNDGAWNENKQAEKTSIPSVTSIPTPGLEIAPVPPDRKEASAATPVLSDKKGTTVSTPVPPTRSVVPIPTSAPKTAVPSSSPAPALKPTDANRPAVFVSPSSGPSPASGSYKQDSGRYTGQIDSNSIEIKISGVPDAVAAKAFRLSEQVKDRFSGYGLKAGEVILVTYELNEHGQPVIIDIQRPKGN